VEGAYAPYSNFYVGAALRSHDDRIVAGSNMENANYSLTIHAEQVALAVGHAAGIHRYSSMAIIARGAAVDTTDITAPCGSCRQSLFEASQIANADLRIILATTKRDKIVRTTISELLPMAFGPRDLGMDLSRYRR